MTQNLINLSKLTLVECNLSTWKGEEVFANILLLDDDVLVLDSPIDDYDDDKWLTRQSSSHTSNTHKENYTNVSQKHQKGKARQSLMMILYQKYSKKIIFYQSSKQLLNTKESRQISLKRHLVLVPPKKEFITERNIENT